MGQTKKVNVPFLFFYLSSYIFLCINAAYIYFKTIIYLASLAHVETKTSKHNMQIASGTTDLI